MTSNGEINLWKAITGQRYQPKLYKISVSSPPPQKKKTMEVKKSLKLYTYGTYSHLLKYSWITLLQDFEMN